MESKITISEIALSKNSQWYNLVTNDGKKVSVNIEKAPKLAAILKDAKAPIELTGNLITKGEDMYLWDPNEKKPGGGKSFTPRDKGFDASMAAAQAVGAMYMTKGFTKEAFDTAFDHVFERIMSKVTKQPVEGGGNS